MHHRRVGVKVINRTHRIRYSILFTFNALVRISHLMRDHESEQVRVNAADEIQLMEGRLYHQYDVDLTICAVVRCAFQLWFKIGFL